MFWIGQNLSSHPQGPTDIWGER